MAKPRWDVCVVGLGYVGLPTACAFAQAGLRTVGVDLKKDVVRKLNAGSTFLSESEVRRVLKERTQKGFLTATTDLKSAVSASDAVVIAVQTPYEKGRAVLEHLKSATREVASSIKRGAVVIVESTVPPGTCEKDLLPTFPKKWKDGRDFYFAYCPERIAPGNSLREFVMNDRVVGANAARSRAKAVELMGSAVKGELHATDIRTAEATKLAENAARDVYIAYANELAKISRRIGVDVGEVIGLANTHPRVKILRPGPGVGGPCLTKDPYLLLASLKDRGASDGTMVRAARSVNESMSREVLELATKNPEPRRGSKIAVLGTAYKPDIDDPRSSPSEPIIRALLREGYRVTAYDPLCAEGFGATMASSLRNATRGASVVLLLVAHSAWLGLPISQIANGMAPHPVVVDAAGISKPEDALSDDYTLKRLGDGKNLALGLGKLAGV